jgi:ParB family chromosome partitioning protein
VSGRLQEVPVDRIVPNPYQPRLLGADDPSLDELAASIRLHGLLQPLLLTRDGDWFVLVAGERRWRAAQKANLTTVPALVEEYTPRQLAENALVENLQRRDLNCLEEAEGYRRLLEEFGLTQAELGQRVGLSQPAVANKLRLLRLSPRIREGISREMISEGHARALASLATPELQELAYDDVVQRGLSVRQTEELVRGMAQAQEAKGDRGRRRQVVRVFTDALLFRNSLLSLVGEMRRSGVEVELAETAESDFYEVHLRIRKGQGRPERVLQPGGVSVAGSGEERQEG